MASWEVIKKCDAVFSYYIRLTYATDSGNVQCVTCGKWLFWLYIQNGHYVSRKHMSLRFSDKNCHPQCLECNYFGKGVMDSYTVYLVEKYGAKHLTYLQQEKQKIVKLTDHEVETMTGEYQKKVDALLKNKNL